MSCTRSLGSWRVASISSARARIRDERARATSSGVVAAGGVAVVDGRRRLSFATETPTAEAAAEAVKKFNGVQLDGRTLKVELAKPSAPRTGGGYRAGGGGGGGNRGRW